MDNAVIRRCILDFYDAGIPEYVVRDVRIPMLQNMVTTVVGGRKTGKTFLTYQIINALIESGTIPSLRHVCYLHFDDERLLELQTDDLSRIDETFMELGNITPKDPVLFVFDEIHRIANWEYFVLRLNRNPNWRVVITGSSADLEEDKVGRQLRGKTITIHLYPLSFAEYLRFRGRDVIKPGFSTSESAGLAGHFNDYLRIGSYPAMAYTEDEYRLDLLRQYFNSIVAADFLENRKIVDPLACKLFLRNILRRNACPYMHKKEHNALASMGHAVHRNSIAQWFDWACESYLIGVNAINSPSVKKQQQNYRKLYAIDWALANAVSAFREPRLAQALESVVYWELRRRGLATSYELVGPGKHEIDFLAGPQQAAPELAIQVCADLSDPTTLEREERSLAIRLELGGTPVEPLILTLYAPSPAMRTRFPVKRTWEWCLDQDG